MPRVSIDLSSDKLAFLSDMAHLEGYYDGEDYLNELFAQFLEVEHFRFSFGTLRCQIEDEREFVQELFDELEDELYLDPGGAVRHEDEIAPRTKDDDDMNDGFPF